MRIERFSQHKVVLAFALILLTAGPARAQSQQTPETTRLIDSVQGPALYTAYCAVCHGPDGKGGGPMAKSLKVATPDLTRIAVANGGSYPAARVQRIISGEEVLTSGHGTRAMPVWGPVFSQIAWDQDLGRMRIYNLSKYIESLQSRK